MSEQIIAVLDALCEKFGIAVDWSQQNVVPVVKELTRKYVTYEIVTSLVWIAFFLFAVLFFIVGIQRCWKIAKRDSINLAYDECFTSFIFVVFVGGLILSIITAVIGVMVQVFDIVTCLTFPEKMILDYLKDLASSK